MGNTAFQEFNASGTILGSATRSADNNSADLVNAHARGVIVYFNLATVPGTDTVNCQIQMKDPVSGTYTTICASGAKATTGLYILCVYPGASNTGSVFAALTAFPLPRDWRVNMDHSAASDFVYSVSYEYLT